MSEYLKREDVRRAVLHNEGDALIAAIDELQPVELPEWIPVTERLPEKSGQYLTYNEFGWFNAYPYSIIHKQWNTQDWMSEKSAKGLGINSITHWMPLPQPPEGIK